MSYKNYLHVPTNKKKDPSMHVHTHMYCVLEFYQLAKGDEFTYNKKKYIKINDEFGETKSGIKKHFWPTETVKLPKKVNLEDLNKKYPITQYEY